MADITKLKALNAQRWAAAKLTRESEYASTVTRVLAAKNRYVQIERRTGVHWVFVACAHLRESNLNFSRQLAQGDPISQVSTHVPKGRGPFASFEDSAVDALVSCAPYASRNKDWSIEGTLTLMEQYNGLGYFNGPVANKVRYPSQPSPYVWAGTDQYRKGKYVADGVYDPNVVDKQLGVAGLIRCLMKADPSISFGTPAVAPAKPVGVPAAVSTANPTGPTPNEPVASPEPSVVDSVVDWLRKH